MNRCLWIGIFAWLTVAGGCERDHGERAARPVTSEEVRRDVAQAAKTTGEYARQTTDEFEQKLAERLKEMEPEMARLREKGHELKDEAKADWDRAMKELQAKWDAAQVKLADLRKSTAPAWKTVKEGAQTAWDDLEKAFNEARRKL